MMFAPVCLSEPAWAAAATAFNEALAAEEQHDREAWDAAYERENTSRAMHGGMPALTDRIPDAIAIEADRLCDVRNEGEEALIAMPAPSLTAAIWKIEYARERWAHWEAWPDAWWTAVMADLRRLDAGVHHV